jgi:hypothetical protein
MKIKSAREQGVVVRGFNARRLVVCAPNSLEPMTVSVPLREIRQVAVLGIDPAETERRFTVACQIDSDKWVRLGVFESASEADSLIRACASAMAGTRWTQAWITLGLSVVVGFFFLVLANLFQMASWGKAEELVAQPVPMTQEEQAQAQAKADAAVAAAAAGSVATPPAPVAPVGGVEQPPAVAAPAPVPNIPQAPVAAGQQDQALKEFFGNQPAKK